MTDQDCYEIMLKWGNGAIGEEMIKEIIRVRGLDGAVNLIYDLYKKEGIEITNDYKDWIFRGFRHIENNMRQESN